MIERDPARSYSALKTRLVHVGHGELERMAGVVPHLRVGIVLVPPIRERGATLCALVSATLRKWVTS
jgi:hypothetical protein